MRTESSSLAYLRRRVHQLERSARAWRLAAESNALEAMKALSTAESIEATRRYKTWKLKTSY